MKQLASLLPLDRAKAALNAGAIMTHPEELPPCEWPENSALLNSLIASYTQYLRDLVTVLRPEALGTLSQRLLNKTLTAQDMREILT